MPIRATVHRALAITTMSACLVCACGGSSSPTTSPTSARGFAGQWSGMTSQGRPITFTISPDEKLTAISVGYNFNGCSGTQTYSNLDIDIKPQIECIPAPCPLPLSSYRSVDYESGHPFQGQSTGIRGFVSDALGLYTGEGVVYFRNYPGCGNAQTGWNVNRLN